MRAEARAVAIASAIRFTSAGCGSLSRSAVGPSTNALPMNVTPGGTGNAAPLNCTGASAVLAPAIASSMLFVT